MFLPFSRRRTTSDLGDNEVKSDQVRIPHRHHLDERSVMQTTEGTQDRGVSPVIGIILMVAITVILAALVGAFVLDIGQQAENDSPQASFSVVANPATDTISLEHLGGDQLRHDETRVVVESGGITEFSAAATGSQVLLTVGNTAVITLNDSSDDTLDFDGDGILDGTVNESAEPLDPDDRVTVTLIDTVTERVIFERSVIVQD